MAINGQRRSMGRGVDGLCSGACRRLPRAGKDTVVDHQCATPGRGTSRSSRSWKRHGVAGLQRK
jgi:hypothetical protein